MPSEGEGLVVRQGQLIAVVVAFLMGCTVVLMAGASGVQAQTSKNEQARCEGTSNTKNPAAGTGGGHYITNDLPGCPKGGLLLGTDKNDRLHGKDGDDEIRALGGNDLITGGAGNDVIYMGPGDDFIQPENVPSHEGEGDDVIYGGSGDDLLQGGKGTDVMYGGDGHDSLDGGSSDHYARDKLYCGEGKDTYMPRKNDYVDSSCEKKVNVRPPSSQDGGAGGAMSGSASGTPQAVGGGGPQPPGTGGPATLLPAAALLLGSGILTYAILRRS
jgi:Ca2+-binding RTX toxin-like protein